MTGMTRARMVSVVAVAVAVAVVAVTGCGARGSEPEVADSVIVQRVGAVIGEPVYSYAEHAVLGLTDDHRIARIDTAHHTATDRTTVSRPLPGLGPNLVISPLNPGTALVAIPDRGQVAEIDTGKLTVSGFIGAGSAPWYLGLDSGARVVLAVSRDGSVVTPVDLHQNTRLPATVIGAGPGATVLGANRGRQLEFHVIGRNRLARYKGQDPPAKRKGALDISAAAAAGDGTKVTRVYVAERGTDRVVAVDARPDGQGLQVVGSAAVGEQVRYLATDDTRIYAVTDHRVVVLESRSVEGYSGGVIPMVRTVEFRGAVPDGPAKSAPVSGIATGNDRVFITLAGQPYLIGVAKPRP